MELFSYQRRYGRKLREMKPAWCTWSLTPVPNTSRFVSFKCILCLFAATGTYQVHSKPAERQNKHSLPSSKPLLLLIHLCPLNSLSSYFAPSRIIRQGHLFLINTLLSLRAAGTQPRERKKNPRVGVPAQQRILDRGWKTWKNNKGDARTGEQNSPLDLSMEINHIHL